MANSSTPAKPRRTSSTTAPRSNAKSATDRQAASGTKTTNSKANGKRSAATDFEIDPELLSEAYDQVRRPSLPYGFILNDKPAGIFIPVDQLEEAGWLQMPEEDELTTAAPSGNDVSGLLLTNVRMLILACTPEYIRYKRDDDLRELSGTIVGLYEEYRHAFNKKTMDACSDHALVFLNDDNQPLHTTAVSVRFKNVALWSFMPAREKFYRQLERTFAEYTQQRFSGKNDRWRALGILEASFVAVKEGAGKNKSWCCKTEAIAAPTIETLPHLFLGTPTRKPAVWSLHDSVAGYADLSLPALPGDSQTVTTQVLPPESKPHQLKNAQVEDDTFDFEDDEELEDDSDLSDDEIEGALEEDDDEELDDETDFFDDEEE